MSLFKSEELRNEQIERELSLTAKFLVTQAYKAIDNTYYRNFYCALFTGAMSVAFAVVTRIESQRGLWGHGGVQKAILLYEICTQPMISMWLRGIWQQGDSPEEEKGRGTENVISTVLQLIGRYSRVRVRDYLNLDTQYNHEEDLRDIPKDTANEDTPNWYTFLLIAKINEALGSRKIIRWDKQAFPVRQSSDFIFARGASFTDIVEPTNTGLRDIRLLRLWLIDSGTDMLKFFREINTSQVEEKPGE